MDFYKKRLLSIIVICVFLFLGGVEFAVIFPTAWDYLKSLGVEDEYMLGITVSAYSLSGAFAGILGGYLADIYPQRTGLFCALCSILMVVGNLQYTAGQYAWSVVGSRLICGLGTAAEAALLAYVCRVTTIKERTAILSVCNASRQIGVLIGPAFQALLTQFNLQIGPVVVNCKNAAGLLMALLWIFVFIPLLLMLGHFEYTMNPLSEYESLSQNDETFKQLPTNVMFGMPSKKSHSFTNKDQMQNGELKKWNTNYMKNKFRARYKTESDLEIISSSEQFPIFDAHKQKYEIRGAYGDDSSDDCCEKASTLERRHRQESTSIMMSRNSSLASIANLMASISTDPTFSNENQPDRQTKKYDLLSDVVVSLLSTAFTLFFCQILIETIIPIYMKESWGFGDIATSMAYLIGGIECLVLFMAVIPISKFVSDSFLHLIGFTFLIIGFVCLASVLPLTDLDVPFPDIDSHFWYFAIGCFTVGIAYPIASVSNTSLLSKALSRDTQGLGQGARRFSTYLGLILGPLWAGSTVRHPCLLMTVTLIIIMIHMTMFLHTMKKLRPIEKYSEATCSGNKSIDNSEYA